MIQHILDSLIDSDAVIEVIDLNDESVHLNGLRWHSGGLLLGTAQDGRLHSFTVANVASIEVFKSRNTVVSLTSQLM